MAKEKKSIQVGKTDLGYKKFLENVGLYALGLDGLSARIDREAYAVAQDERTEELSRELKNVYRVIDFDSHHFDVAADFSLIIQVEGEEPLLSIQATYSAHFHPKRGSFKEADAARFAESEARLIFWPYFRQTVSDTTARMHVRPITIPLTFRS